MRLAAARQQLRRRGTAWVGARRPTGRCGVGRQQTRRHAATTSAEPVLDISMHPGGAPGSLGYHDAGGAENAGPVLAAGADRPHAHWERRVHGLCGVLVGKGLLSVDEMRRGWEQLQPQAYDRMSYYEKWAASITNIMLQRGILTQASLDRQVILPTAPAVSNEGGSSPLLVPLPAVSWPWVPSWGSLEPSRQGGENTQKTGKNGGKMGEIRSKKREGGITWHRPRSASRPLPPPSRRWRRPRPPPPLTPPAPAAPSG